MNKIKHTELEKLTALSDRLIADPWTGEILNIKTGDPEGGWKEQKYKKSKQWYLKLSVQIGGRENRYQINAHRFMWFQYYGEVPPKLIDHVEGVSRPDISLNRIENLRDGTKNREQYYNAVGADSRSCWFRGVSLVKRTGKYVARISIDGKSVCLGTFKVAFVAACAYENALREHEAAQ